LYVVEAGVFGVFTVSSGNEFVRVGVLGVFGVVDVVGVAVAVAVGV